MRASAPNVLSIDVTDVGRAPLFETAHAVYGRWLGGGDFFGGGMPDGQNAISEAFVDSGGVDDSIGHFTSPAPLDPVRTFFGSTGGSGDGWYEGEAPSSSGTLLCGQDSWHTPSGGLGTYPKWYWESNVAWSVWQPYSRDEVHAGAPTADPSPGDGNGAFSYAEWTTGAVLPSSIVLSVPWVADPGRGSGALRAHAKLLPKTAGFTPALNWPTAFTDDLGGDTSYTEIGVFWFDATTDGLHDWTWDLTAMDQSALSTYAHDDHPTVIVVYTVALGWVDLPAGDDDPEVHNNAVSFDMNYPGSGPALQGTCTMHYSLSWVWVGGSYEDDGPALSGPVTVMAWDDADGPSLSSVLATNPATELERLTWPFASVPSDAWVALPMDLTDTIVMGS